MRRPDPPAPAHPSRVPSGSDTADTSVIRSRALWPLIDELEIFRRDAAGRWPLPSGDCET